MLENIATVFFITKGVGKSNMACNIVKLVSFDWKLY